LLDCVLRACHADLGIAVREVSTMRQ
jgi:hypothetical protein